MVAPDPVLVSRLEPQDPVHRDQAASFSIILWSVDTRDWSAVIRQRAAVGLTQQHPVILLHDGPGNRAATVAALEGIINDYRSRGYRFVTFDQSG